MQFFFPATTVYRKENSLIPYSTQPLLGNPLCGAMVFCNVYCNQCFHAWAPQCARLHLYVRICGDGPQKCFWGRRGFYVFGCNFLQLKHIYIYFITLSWKNPLCYFLMPGSTVLHWMLCSTDRIALHSFPSSIAGGTDYGDPALTSYMLLPSQEQDGEEIRRVSALLPTLYPGSPTLSVLGPQMSKLSPGIHSVGGGYFTGVCRSNLAASQPPKCFHLTSKLCCLPGRNVIKKQPARNWMFQVSI